MRSLKHFARIIICTFSLFSAFAFSQDRYGVLAYHSVVDESAAENQKQYFPQTISAQTLIKHFNWLKENGYNVISWQQVIDAENGKGTLPDNAVLLSFDDGYETMYSVIFPLLKAYNYPAIFAPVTSWLDTPQNQKIHYADKILDRSVFATWEQVKEMATKYKRVLYKLSGEALAGGKGFGIDSEVVTKITSQIVEVVKKGVEVAIVVGGGNIWRGKTGEELGMERATADSMGMLATVMNSLALQDALEQKGVDTRVLTSVEMKEMAEPYIRRRAIRHLEKGRVAIFAAGIGNPYFSTDTTAALRAKEIGAEAILMGKNGVDGVYSADPKLDSTATKYDKLSYMDIMNKGLTIMDSTAITFCMDNHLPIIVFSIDDADNIVKVVSDSNLGTIIE